MRPPKPIEAEKATWIEPFAAMYARIRYQSYIVVGLVVVILVLGIELFLLGSKASAHVYEVRPDGSADYIGDRQANNGPRPAEARFVTKHFISLLYGWNSSTIHDDVADAVNMCSPPMAKQLKEEIAAQQIVTNLRKRNIRSEIEWQTLEVADQGDRAFRVKVAGRVHIYPLAQYEGDPIDTRAFSMQVVLGVVPRDPEVRLNGLEVVRIERDNPTAPTQEKSR